MPSFPDTDSTLRVDPFHRIPDIAKLVVFAVCFEIKSVPAWAVELKDCTPLVYIEVYLLSAEWSLNVDPNDSVYRQSGTLNLRVTEREHLEAKPQFRGGVAVGQPRNTRVGYSLLVSSQPASQNWEPVGMRNV